MVGRLGIDGGARRGRVVGWSIHRCQRKYSWLKPLMLKPLMRAMRPPMKLRGARTERARRGRPRYHGAGTATMVYRLLADAVVLAHLAFVAFVVAGGLLVRWRRWVAAIHVPAAAWGVFVEFSGRVCPLTPLENGLRALAGDAVYSGDFVERYLTPVLYPPGLRRDVQIALGVFALAVTAVIYVHAWRRARPTLPLRANRAVGGRGASHLRGGRTGEGHPSTDGNGPDRTRSP
jgi:hypothetical protein